MLPLHFFLQGLIHLALARSTKRRRHLLKSRRFTKQIQTWVKKGNPNCHHMLLLLQAETLSLSSKNNVARIRKGYDDAVASAARSGFLHHQALANERAALFFVAQEDYNWATAYFQKSRALYMEYGAKAKASHLDELCEKLDLDLGADSSTRGSSLFARSRLGKLDDILARNKRSQCMEELMTSHSSFASSHPTS